jgi:hypothetical protein
MAINYGHRPLTENETRAVAKAVHDEMYSIENTLKRRGYVYAGEGDIKNLLLPN